MLYLVCQQPKQKNRGGMSSGVVVVDARSAAEAVRTAAHEHPEFISKHPDFRAPAAFQVVDGMALFL